MNAFRYIVDACRRGLTSPTQNKVIFVWHSWASQRINNIKLIDFYPGDDYVDWIGISLFQQLYPWETEVGGNVGHVEEVLNFASLHQKVKYMFVVAVVVVHFFFQPIFDMTCIEGILFVFFMLIFDIANDDCRINTIWRYWYQ